MDKENLPGHPDIREKVRSKVQRIVAAVIGGIMMAALFIFLFGLIVKLLWNGLMPVIFGLPVINYWQSLGILILAKLLFGSFGHGHKSKHYHKKKESKWHRFNGAEFCRPGYKSHWKHYHRFWEEEGRQAFEAYLNKQDTSAEEPSSEPTSD